MTAQDEMQILLRFIQTQIQKEGVAKVSAVDTKRMHTRIYKAMRRRGWQMKIAHDAEHVIIRLVMGKMS